MGWKLPAYLTIKALLTTKMNFFSPHTAITQLTNIPWQFATKPFVSLLNKQKHAVNRVTSCHIAAREFAPPQAKVACVTAGVAGGV